MQGDLFGSTPAPPPALSLVEEAARRCLVYDPETGHINHKTTGGPPDGWLSADGYRMVRIAHRVIVAHKVAWFLHTGAWPTGQIDHINRIRGDNRWANLRQVTPKENAQNRALPTRDPNVKRCPEGYWEVIHRGRPEGQFLTYEEAVDVAQFLRTYA